MTDDPTLADWLRTGIRLGFCSEPVCGTHDGTLLLPEEYDAYDAGDDPCVTMIRLW